MRVISLALLFSQTGVIAQGTLGRQDFAFYWQTRLEPPSPFLANSLGYASGVSPKSNNIYRVMIDRTARVYFGYEVRVEPLPQGYSKAEVGAFLMGAADRAELLVRK